MDTTVFLPAIPGAPRALALNGGGTSGRATATFLQAFEEATGKDCLNVFDLVIGVSTGAILAAGLGAGKTAKTMAEVYEAFIPKIFPTPAWWNLPARFVRGWIEGAHYRQRDLRNALTEVFGAELEMGDLEGRVAIQSCQLTAPMGPVTWCSWRRRHKGMKVVDALVASCSAPTYFRPFILDGSAYIDGAMACNNPSMEAVCLLEELSGQVDNTYVLNVRATTITGMPIAKVRRLGSAASWLAMLPTTFMNMSDVNAERQLKAVVNECTVVNMPLNLPLDYHDGRWCEEMDSAAMEAWKANSAALVARFH